MPDKEDKGRKVSARNGAKKSAGSVSSGAVGKGVDEVFDDGCCGICSSNIGKEDKGVECEACSTWYHPGCAGLPNEVYIYLNTSGLHWLCQSCDGKFDKIIKLFNKTEQQFHAIMEDINKDKMEREKQRLEDRAEHDKLRRDVESNLSKMKLEHEQLIGKIRNDIEKVLAKETEIENKVNVLESKVNAIEKGSLETGASGRVEEMIFSRSNIIEQIEIDKRKINLIFMGIREGANEGDVVNKVIEKLDDSGVRDVITSIERIGERKDSKIRPIRVKFRNISVRNKLLRNAVKLKDTEFREIYLSPDLTPRQQLNDKNLRHKLKDIRSNVDEDSRNNIRIKQGKIIKNVNGREEILFPPSQSLN